MAWMPAILFCREVPGPDRGMYTMDYPCANLVIEEKQFYQTNAEEVFNIPKGDA